MNKALYDHKLTALKERAAYRRGLYLRPELKNLFYEFTQKCNENCFHCGSKCESLAPTDCMSVEDWKALTREVALNFPRKPMLCITGGEPLLYDGLFEVMSHAASLGFVWGMTTNATLIDHDCAQALKKAGMSTVSVSIDGLESTHDAQRGLKGGYDLAMNGIGHLLEAGFDHVQVTTVINHRNIGELPELFEIMDELPIDSWRVINLEPIGRALLHPGYMLDKEDYARLFSFIREKRELGYPVCYGCSHYLGIELERDLRDWYFYCTAGRTTASVMSDGSVGACLDIPRIYDEKDGIKTIQGNVKERSFTDIWENEFKVFRQELSDICVTCGECEETEFCAGGSWHSLDCVTGEQQMCFKKML